jgi:hypothetical protein
MFKKFVELYIHYHNLILKLLNHSACILRYRLQLIPILPLLFPDNWSDFCLFKFGFSFVSGFFHLAYYFWDSEFSWINTPQFVRWLCLILRELKWLFLTFLSSFIITFLGSELLTSSLCKQNDLFYQVFVTLLDYLKVLILGDLHCLKGFCFFFQILV